MTPVFDADACHVAWFDGQYVFDLDVAWIASHDKGEIFHLADNGRDGKYFQPLARDESSPTVALKWIDLRVAVGQRRRDRALPAFRLPDERRDAGHVRHRRPLLRLRVDGEEVQPFHVNGNFTCFQNPFGT